MIGMSSRRGFLITSSALVLAACVAPAGLTEDAVTTVTNDPFLVDIDRQPDEVFTIWPNGAPGLEAVDLEEHFVARDNAFGLPDRAARDVTAPTLTYFRSENYNGNTMLLIPGGGYRHVVVEKEGWEGARYFNQFGYDVYVLTYRLPFQGWPAGPETPLQDAQRATRLVRQHGSAERGSVENLLVMGFSAGGHLAGTLSQKFDELTYEPVDAADELSARPDLSVLVYPVALMNSPNVHAGSRQNLLGDEPSVELMDAWDLSKNVDANSPPLFLLHALDDQSVVMENSMEVMQAYREADIPAVLHIFEHGGHGFGMRGIYETPLEDWPGLVMNWATSNGFSPSEH
ncbi:alpha/beta hydrolase [Ponticaulis sp.]|uniref:alpha/beta hydrolase n=1 Tax=Ponticaulis sp. TaxID=2020902 RepID=UPI000B632F2C|nr:alpha/beta hydrolase [Ponticaulis sp.]MAI91513.1 alpha/beta hydrolase [Ponticaulis sp.]OUX97476.1 MAG: hypothetical protein CBB65_13815 [Hyphomonadaceae bacterium TMED5]|tara:strand:- start:25930 stop:26961 length:1032 start_codon:yes stop_codon:yes gene_type:complete